MFELINIKLVFFNLQIQNQLHSSWLGRSIQWEEKLKYTKGRKKVS